MIKLLTLIFITFSFNLAIAHTGTLKGTVINKENKETLPGVVIRLKNTNLQTATNTFGIFQIDKITPGNYIMYFNALGYIEDSIEVNISEKESEPIIIRMEPTSIELKSVLISGNEKNNIQTLSKIDIALRPTRTSQDILRMIPGLVTAQHAGGGKAEQIFLRGFDIDHGTDIALQVDGVPVNMVSHAHGQGYADLHFLIPETVENVDFNKGPYYAEYGDFNTAGYASFQTRNSFDQNQIKLEGGMYNSYRLTGLFNLYNKAENNSTQDISLASEYNYSDGYFDSPQHFNRINVMGKYHISLNNDKIINLTLSHFKSDWDASGQVPERAIRSGMIDRFGSINDNEGGTTSRSSANLEITKILNSNSYFKNQLFFVKYNFQLYSDFTFFLNDPINGDMIRQKESRDLYGYKGSYHTNYTIGKLKSSAEAGIGLRSDQTRNSELSSVKERTITIAPLALGDIHQYNVSGYISETTELFRGFTVNAAIRIDALQFNYVNHLDTLYNNQSVTKSIISPKLNFSYSPNSTLHIFLKSGTGFHSNDTRVVVQQNGTQILPKAYGIDAGFIFKPYDRLITGVTIWMLNLDQEFVYVGDEAVVEAGGKTERRGIDFMLRLQINPWLFADGDLNMTRPRLRNAPESENRIPLAPEITSIGGLTVKLSSGLSGSIRFRHVGDRPANETNSVVAKGYTLLDAVIKYEKKQFAIGLTAENILNSDWNEAQFDTESQLQNESSPVSELHFTPGNPIWVRGSVAYKF